jgi:hypothetical protein
MDRFKAFFFKSLCKPNSEKGRFGENHPFWRKKEKSQLLEKVGPAARKKDTKPCF